MREPVYPYICERCKNAPPKNGFTRTYRWKTERGFQDHKCYTEAQEKRDKTRLANAEKRKAAEQDREDQRRRDFEKRLAERISQAKYHPGDHVFAAYYIVTKPEYIWRRDRQVRVRYEEGREYRAGILEIAAITMYGYETSNSRAIADNDIFPTLAEATTAAREREAKYKEQCEFAERCR